MWVRGLSFFGHTRPGQRRYRTQTKSDLDKHPAHGTPVTTYYTHEVRRGTGETGKVLTVYPYTPRVPAHASLVEKRKARELVEVTHPGRSDPEP